MPKTVAVIPAYNEGARIGRVIEGVSKFVDKVIVVNDASIDNTSLVARRSGCCVIDLPSNRGAGFATRSGCEYALSLGAEVIVTIDADGQHNPEDVPLLLEPIFKKEAEITFGIRRRNDKMPLVKKIANAVLYFISKLIFGSNIKDSLTGFHAFTVKCYRNLSLESCGYEVVVEFVYKTVKNKLKYKEVVVETIYNNKEGGMNKRHGLRAIFCMVKWKLKEW